MRESEAQYKALVETTGTGCVILDDAGRVLDANAEYVRLTGRASLGDILGRSVVEWTAPHDRDRNAKEVRKCIEQGSVRGLEVDYAWPDGTTCVPIEVNATVRQSQGRMTILTLCRDITERRRAERALLASEHQYRLTLNSMTDSIHVVNRDLDIVLANEALQRWARRFGVPDVKVGQNLLDAFPFLPERVLNEYHHVFGTGEILDTSETTHVTGNAVVTETRKVPIVEDGAVARVLTVMRDITERQKAEDALRRTQEELERRVTERTAQLRALAAELTRVESKERRRLADVLHEDIQQMLAGARYRLDGLGPDATAEEYRHAAQDVSEILVRATDIASSLSIDLRPPVLYDEGLGAALSWLAADMKRRFGLETDVDVEPGAEPADDDLRIFLFNAVRELLFNVAKHSGVHSAAVRLRPGEGDRIEVEVADSGSGFAADNGSARGFGLFGIRERAGFFGGDTRVESAPGRGTRITLSLPRR